MKAQFRKLLFSLAPAVAAALLSGGNAQATAIQVNATCEVGNCATVDQLTYGGSIALTPFNFNYTFPNTDVFNVAGQFSASYGAAGNHLAVSMTVLYQGTTGNPSAVLSNSDTLTIHVLQNVYDNGPGTYDGLYTENVPVVIGNNVGASSSLSANLFYDGLGVGPVGPFVGPGSYNGFASATLTDPLLANPLLTEDFQFVYAFTAGTQPGAGVSVPFANNTPEPAETLPLALTFTLLSATILNKGKLKI